MARQPRYAGWAHRPMSAPKAKPNWLTFETRRRGPGMNGSAMMGYSMCTSGTSAYGPCNLPPAGRTLETNAADTLPRFRLCKLRRGSPIGTRTLKHGKRP